MNISTPPSPQAILRLHSKSFYLASLFLGRKTAQQVARLYRFCRIVDDLVDTNPDPRHTRETLQNWLSELETGATVSPAVADMLALQQVIPFNIQHLQLLIQGVLSDLSVVRIQDELELIQYCYLVAGTVGLMMCSLLGATDPRAKKFAVDLGIAMQLTNILRDVAEDAASGRQYIPDAWLPQPTNLLEPTAALNEKIKPALERLFELGQKYYQSGYAGLRYLPLGSRLAILIAARLYQDIALQAKRRHFQCWQERIVISNWRKSGLIVCCLLRFVIDVLKPAPLPAHNVSLHRLLTPWLSRW